MDEDHQRRPPRRGPRHRRPAPRSNDAAQNEQSTANYQNSQRPHNQRSSNKPPRHNGQSRFMHGSSQDPSQGSQASSQHLADTLATTSLSQSGNPGHRVGTGGNTAHRGNTQSRPTNQPSRGAGARGPPRNTLEPLEMIPGEKCTAQLVLVPWKLVLSYPAHYVHEEHRDTVKQHFEKNLQTNWIWDFYYIPQPGPTAKDALLLVPLSQLVKFLSDVAETVGEYKTYAKIRHEKAFHVGEESSEWPQPRFLGRMIAFKNNIKNATSQIQRYPKDGYDDLSIEGYKAFKMKMEELHVAGKGRSVDAVKSRFERLEKQKYNSRMMKRVQRYLGLRGSGSLLDAQEDATTSWNPNAPAPHQAQDTVRFVCVDVEAYEFDNKTLTEFGFSILDTEDIIDIAPGENGDNWIARTKTYHYRIREFTHLKNKRFVAGCPEKFNFGRSEFVMKKDMARVTGSHIGNLTTPDKRPVILVGHDIMGDLKYLRQIGFNVWNAPYVIDEVDTQSMFRRLTKDTNGRGLSTTCDTVGIPTKDFHNAGNDAYYTLAAMIAMAVKQKTAPKENLKNWEIVEAGEWSDGDADDGGAPIRSSEPYDKACDPGAASPAPRPKW